MEKDYTVKYTQVKHTIMGRESKIKSIKVKAKTFAEARKKARDSVGYKKGNNVYKNFSITEDK